MRPLLQAAVLLAAATTAFVIPPTPHLHHNTVKDTAVAGSTAPNELSVYFSIPCTGCFADASDELDIELKVDSSSTPCQSSAIVLNDVRLSLMPSPIRFKANITTTSNVQKIAASWELSCLNAEVSILSLRIDDITGEVDIQPGIGFSASFRQGAAPEFLRLEHAPIDTIHGISALQRFAEPQENPEFVAILTPTTNDERIPDELQKQLRRLHEIKAHMGRLHHQYMRQEHRVFEIIKQDFSACHGATCIFQTAIKKAPDFLELLKAHFRHRPDWSKLHGSGVRKQGNDAIMFDVFEEFNDELGDGPSPVEDFTADHTPFPLPFDEPHREDFPPPPPLSPGPPPHDDDHPPLPPHWDHDGPPPPPEHHRHHPPPPPPEHHGHHPPPPPPEHHGHHPSPPWHHEGGSIRPHGKHPPWAGHRKPGHHRPHFLQRHGPHRHPFFFSAGSILLFAILASLLFKCVRAKTGLFRDNHRERDCATRREECRNRAAYKRAALRHRWGRWWSQFRRPESTADYEEKRARILGQEDNLEDVMQSEIRELRRAHEIVDDMMRAEGSRQRMYHEANFGSSSSQSPLYPQGLQRQNTESSQSTDSILPLYQPPPPTYDQELEGEMTVVDGFLYTPSATDSTPESSVVDCSPRMSFETSTTLTKA